MTRMALATSLILFIGLAYQEPVGAQDIARLQAGVVRITSKSRPGTGFIVRLEGDAAYILTAAHVVEKDPNPKVEFFTKQNVLVQAEVLRGAEGDDEMRGLALLLVRGKEDLPAGVTALQLDRTRSFSAADDVIVIGFPRGAGPWNVIKGSIGSTQGSDIYFSPTVETGNSGGPIIRQGNVIGIVMATESSGRGLTADRIQSYIAGFGLTALGSTGGSSTAARPSAPRTTMASPEPQPATPAREITGKDEIELNSGGTKRDFEKLKERSIMPRPLNRDSSNSRASSGKRVAFVVGIGTYDNLAADKQLKNAVNDAEGVSARLTEIGFQVTKASNLTRSAFNAKWQNVLDSLTRDDKFVLFFSGHGVQIEGQNYLLPRDIPLIEYSRQAQLTREAISLNKLVADLSIGNRPHPQSTVLILDASQENPFIPPSYNNGPTGGELGGLPQTDGVFVMYAAASNQTALDRLSSSDNAKYSVFTRTLLPLMGRTDLSIQELGLELKDQVWKLAKSVGWEQRPIYYDGLHGRFCLPGCAVQ